MTMYSLGRQERRGAPESGHRFRPRVEALEERALLSVCTVDRLTDTGAGSGLAGDLRYCITQAQDGDTITFQVKGTINLTRALPDLTRSVRIEGPGADLLTVRRDTGGFYNIFRVAGGTTVSIVGLTITNGLLQPSFPQTDGGAIANRGTLTLSDSTLSGNRVLIEGCDECTMAGAIYNAGTLTVNNSTLSDNHFATNSGGFGVGAVYNRWMATVTIIGSTLSENSSIEGPGGILNLGTLTISHSSLSGNSGGGIRSSGMLTVSNSTIAGNPGTGIEFEIGTATISNSTISGNSGGGIRNYSGTLTVSNSTISGNSAGSPRIAGGISNHAGNSDATVILLNSTIANNTVSGSDRTASQLYAGRFGGTRVGTIQFRNTIISGDGPQPNFFADVGGMFVTEGHNLSSDDGSSFLTGPGDLINTDPLLGPLQDNGGPTWTHALLPGSPALDAGDNTDAPKFDQRGLPRIVAETLDIGSFEVQPGPATWFWLDAPASVASGAPFDVTLYALDDYGHLATGYEGTVTFLTTDMDSGVLLPADYTFTADDQGLHTFADETMLVTSGEQYLWAWDTDSGSYAEAAVTVVPGGAPAPGADGGISRQTGFLPKEKSATEQTRAPGARVAHQHDIVRASGLHARAVPSYERRPDKEYSHE